MKAKRYHVFVGTSPWSETLPTDYRMSVMEHKGKTKFCRTTARKHLKDMKAKGYSGYLEEVN